MNRALAVQLELLVSLALAGFPLVGIAASSDEETALAQINAASARINTVMQEAAGPAGRIVALERFRPDYPGNTAVSSFLLQAIGTEYSFAGQHLKALQTFDEQFTFGAALVEDVKELQLADAVDTILKLSADRQILMINEAHHVAQHRVLTYRLLERLWDQGYRYFAAEAFAQAAENELAAHGYPTGNTGHYIQEPLFSNLVAYAVELGFKPVSYDFTFNGGTEERETGGAQAIASKIFSRDPQARVVIHVGYSHINEQSWLASKLREMLNIDPLTVNQTDLAEKSNADDEPQSYTWLVDNRRFDAPSVLLDADGQPWSLKKDEYDINVVWPRTRYDAGRPAWAALDRTAMPIDTAWCQQRFPCTVEVFRYDNENELPSDRIVIESADQQVSLFLHTGANVIAVTDIDGQRVHTMNVEHTPPSQ